MSFGNFARKASDLAGRPIAFAIAAGTVVVWAITGPFLHFSEVWQLTINTGTTIVTFLMVFLVQNTQNHNEEALHKKLDELILHLEGPRNEIAGIEREY